MAESRTGSSQEPAEPDAPPRHAARERALLALSVALLIGVMLTIVFVSAARPKVPTATNVVAIATDTSSAPIFPTAQQIPPGTGWIQSGPAWAQGIAFAPSAPATAYVCGAPALRSNDRAVPIVVGTSDNALASWRTLATPASAVACRMTVDPTDARDVVLDVDSCGYCGNAARDTLYRSRDGGHSWSDVTPPVLNPAGSGPGIYAGFSSWAWVGSSLFLVPFVSGQHAWTQLVVSVAGSPFVPISHQRIFGDAAQASVEINEVFGATTSLYVMFDSGNDCTQNCDRPMRMTTSTGDSWRSFNPMYLGRQVSLLSAGSDGASLFGQSVTAADDSSRVYVSSTDGGVTWQPLPPFPPNMIAWMLIASPDGTLYAETEARFDPSSSPNGIYRLAPGARQWVFVSAWPVAGWLTLSWDAQGHPLALWGAAYQPSDNSMAPGLEYHPAS